MKVLHDGLNKRVGGVYKITNIINGKYYIGSSMYIKGRWNEHIRCLKNQTHDNRYLQRAWNKYGRENFSFEILECILVRDKDLLNEREQAYLDDIFQHQDRADISYNMCSIANSHVGVPQTEESKIKKGRVILQIDCTSLEVIDKYLTVKRAADLMGVKATGISACCRKKVPQIKGFIWRYEDDDLSDLEPWVRYQNLKRRTVYQFNADTYEFIKEWSSAREAANFYSLDENNLSRICKIESKCRCGSYRWSYSRHFFDNKWLM